MERSQNKRLMEMPFIEDIPKTTVLNWLCCHERYSQHIILTENCIFRSIVEFLESHLL